MSNISFQGKFIEQAEAFVLENISNEQFGVSELAESMNMSRSNLLRKIKKETQLSASQFIRQVRLQKGLIMLTETELTVSEISYLVGFGNNSYFIKCFREHFGYSPGEARKKTFESAQNTAIEPSEKYIHKTTKPFKYNIVIIAILTLLIITIGTIIFFNTKTQNTAVNHVNTKKSIAILPFKNMSNDSTNLYFVNGLMESSLNNLQKIKDLRVISRTSVEKYRNTNKTVSEIAKELNVTYLVEGSGQRIGDQVLLNIQLIDALNDTPIWTEQYNHKILNIFDLQNTVAKKIAAAIKATVTQSELLQIDKKPTENLEAYEYYLKALEPFQTETKEGLKKAIPLFEKAIAIDSKFALAYSKLAISYYYLDINQAEKQYTDIINNYADKSLLYDSKSAESLISKALYYINIHEFRLAVPYLEKALEYNPNSSSVVQILADIYSRVIPDTAKYLKYALLGLQIDIEANDSITKSYMYLSLSNAFIQNGFVDQANKYIDLSLTYNPKNYYAPFLKVFIQYATHQNIEKTTKALVNEWKKDTLRLDILQEVGKFYYFQENYNKAYYYYKKFVDTRQKNGLNIYPQENLKIGYVYEKIGKVKEAETLYKAYDIYCKNDQSIYQPASLAMKYLKENKPELAIQQLNKFASNNNYQYWILLFLEKDPLVKPLKNHPKYDALIQKINTKFWENHQQLKKTLKETDLLK